MKKFTEKEIELFLDFIKEGIFETEEIVGDPACSDYIADNVCKVLTEDIIENLDFKNLSNWIDKVYANDKLFKNEIIPFAKDLNKLINERTPLSLAERLEMTHVNVNRQSLAAILGLRDWATKEDIINEINNIL